MTAAPSVLISGASIAGPALAHGLVRRGFRVTLGERAPALRLGGHAVDVRGRSTAVLERMGLYEAARAARTRIETLSAIPRPGGASIDVDIGRLKRAAKTKDLEIVRDDLVRILFDAVKDDVEVIFGDSVKRIDADSGEVEFELAPARRFDLVVGADGHHSTTRALVFGPELSFAHPLDAAVAIFPIANFLGLTDHAIMFSTPGRSAAVYTNADNQSAKAVLLFRTPPLGVGPRDVEAQKRALRDRYHDMGWELPRILDALKDAPDFYFDEMSQIRMPRWSRGRVVLVGDAAHGPSALSGQGTTLALVGAEALARTLQLHDLARSLAAWEAALRPYVKENQAIAKFGKRFLIPDSHAAIWLRNQALRFLPKLARLRLGFGARIARASGDAGADSLRA